MGIGIVVAQFNKDITQEMETFAVEYAKSHGVKVMEITPVPGVFDVPLAVKKLLQRKEIEGVAALGAVIQGETHHDIVIMSACAHALAQLSLQYSKPVSLGIIGPRASWKQAMARKKEYAERAVETIISLRELK